MAVELLPETPTLLKERHVIHFSPGWPAVWEKKFFRVALTQQVEYEATYIISAGSGNTYDVDFDKPSTGGVSAAYKSLLPTSPDTVYEILIGIKGLVVIFPRYNNSYFGKLEVSNVVPDPADTSLKYLGFIGERQSPYYSPRLREYTVKDVQPPALRLFNNMPNEERVVLRFIVNRCRVDTVSEGNLSREERERAREAKHFSIFTW